MSTVNTLKHSDNRGKVITLVISLLILLGDYSGTLPAILQPHRDWIELLAYLAAGVSLLKIDPKHSPEK